MSTDFSLFGSKKKKSSNSNKVTKRIRVNQNREIGLGKQKLDEVKYAMASYTTTTRKTGYDFDAVKGKKRLFVESKASKTAPMRPKQKEMQKKKGRNYKVERGLLD